MEEFRCPFTFGETKSGEQSLFHISILVVSRWRRESIEDLTGCFLIQCSNYMVILCSIVCDPTDVKLCFSWKKPDIRLLCPESWEVDGNCISLCHVLPSMTCITMHHKNHVTTNFIQCRIVYQYNSLVNKT